MTKADFKKIVADGQARDCRFLVVKIETEGNPCAEVIFNPTENVASKMAYYDRAYNDDMELISAKASGKSIRIVDALMTSNIRDLNWFIY